MQRGFGAGMAVAVGLAWTAAHAEEAARPLRLIGETSASDKGGTPRRFVIDARVKPGDGEFQSTLEGWFAGLDDNPPAGAIDGSCVEKHCAFTVTVEDGKMSFTGDYLDAEGPVTAHFTIKDEDDKVSAQSDVTLRPLTGPIAGFGPLAAPDAIDAAGLDDLLLWSHQSVPTGERGGEPVGDSQREALADWQKAQGRSGTGLLFTSDLAQLSVDAAAAKAGAGWTALGDAAHGWAAGYPAAVLPQAGHDGGQQRFASVDGKAVLMIAIETPMSEADFDALVERETADNAARSDVGYNRVNGDMDLHYQEQGVVHLLAWHNREGGLARMSFAYPAAAAETYEPYGAILPASFQVSDELKR